MQVPLKIRSVKCKYQFMEFSDKIKFFILFQLNLIAKQRDEQERAAFRRKISQFQPHQFLFIDESAKDERTFQV